MFWTNLSLLMKATICYQAVKCTSDNTCICYGRNNGFTTNDWQEKHIFVYLVDLVRMKNFAVFARPSQKIVNFVNFIAKFNPGHKCRQLLSAAPNLRLSCPGQKLWNCDNHLVYYKRCRWWQKICLTNQAFIKWTFKIISILDRHGNLHFTLKVSRVTNITFLLTIIINTSSSKLVNMRIHKMVTKGRCLRSNPLLN